MISTVPWGAMEPKSPGLNSLREAGVEGKRARPSQPVVPLVGHMWGSFQEHEPRSSSIFLQEACPGFARAIGLYGIIARGWGSVGAQS